MFVLHSESGVHTYVHKEQRKNAMIQMPTKMRVNLPIRINPQAVEKHVHPLHAATMVKMKYKT